MFLRTVQGTAIRNIFEVLKDIINDVNLYFDENGLTIITLDMARASLIHLHLDAENFEEYRCPLKIVAGMNMFNMYKLLKSVGANDIVDLSIDTQEFITINIQNQVKKSMTKFDLKLLDINEDILVLPEIVMDVTTTLPSADFQRICRDMGSIASDIDIYRDGASLNLECKGDFANQKTVMDCQTTVDTKIGNTFSLKYLNLFTKATGMSSSVQILQNSMSSDMPIVLRYSIANLGEIKFYLAPKTEC
jgi:proliferating cell nuclear antigen